MPCPQTTHTQSAAQTRAWAKKFAQTLSGNEIIALVGALGAGKTEMVKGLARALGIRKPIISPTFLIRKSYPGRLGLKKVTLHHLDCYRLESAADAEALGLEELMDRSNRIMAIEWPEKISRLLPKNHIEIKFKHGKKFNERHIQYFYRT